MKTPDLIKGLGNRGEKLLQDNLHSSEEILVKLKGSFGEGLVITARGIYILKWGFMTNNTFGGRCGFFEYKNITGIDFRKSFLQGTFEVLTPSHQNAQKSYFGTGQNSAISSDNIITFQSSDFKLFQEATRIARESLAQKSEGQVATALSDVGQLEKLAELRDKGVITEEEFSAKKKQILGL